MKMTTTFLPGLLAVTIGALNAGAQTNGLIVHEWGTFTSFQGSDGNLMEWKPLETSKLPSFVYNWTNDSLGRLSPDPAMLYGKGVLLSLQRMETPVIYFYSDKDRTVDVSVHFPLGRITEWFPQADQIGPAVATSNTPSYLTKSVVSSESMIRWPQVRVLASNPENPDPKLASDLPGSPSGSHYFTARATDADTLELFQHPPTQWPRHEHFLFYRGVAGFSTPLVVTMKTDNEVTLSNTGAEDLRHLFVLTVHGNSAAFTYVSQLASKATTTVSIQKAGNIGSLDKIAADISAQMSSALVKTGLFPREAQAMVNTWKDSWFQEQGMRVLYTLPRNWTDRTLPLTVNPAPANIIRTMVGRAEVMSPGLERKLADGIIRLRQGDLTALSDTQATLKDLGRFQEPALNRALAIAHALPAEYSKLMAQLQLPTKSN
jgi:hypothetical protein